MREYRASEQSLVDEFLETLRNLPEAHVELAHGSLGFSSDAQVQLALAGKSIGLQIEAKKALHPRDVREALWRVREASANSMPITQHVLIAESISPGAKELLRKERVGYFASGGSLYLPIAGAYVFVDAPATKTATRRMRSLFTGRRGQVLRTLLADPGEWFGITKIAKRSQAAASTVSEVVGQLEQHEWLESRGLGPSKERQLLDPGAVLDAWASHIAAVRAPSSRSYYVPRLQHEELMQQLHGVMSAHQVSYAVSFEAAGQRYAPFLSNVTKVKAWLTPGSAGVAALAALQARVVQDGANLVVIESKANAELLFRREVEGVWLASPIQVYLDLLAGEGRGREMAEHLRRECIGF